MLGGSGVVVVVRASVVHAEAVVEDQVDWISVKGIIDVIIKMLGEEEDKILPFAVTGSGTTGPFCMTLVIHTGSDMIV